MSRPYMTLPFRQHHIIIIMEDYDDQSLPLDLFIGNYFREHKALGAKDRAEIAETVYGMIRWKSLIDYAYQTNLPPNSKDYPPNWEQRFEVYSQPSFSDLKSNEEIPPHIRLSFPKLLFDLIENTHGLEKAIEICGISNTAAPTTVRINTMKTSRDEMLSKWKNFHNVIPCPMASNGISFDRRISFSAMPEFREGLFEIQDEGSQLLADLVQAEPGQLVLDYCAGAGGKTLAFAPRMQNKGQIFLHDIRKHALEDCRKRLKRAGIQNAQVAYAEDPKLKKLKKNMDWVLVDAPCTGTGTLRRNPDMKWKIDDAMLTRLLGQQRTIFEKALSFLKPNGHIVYATCSVLKQENREQMNHFMKTYNLEVVGDIFESNPVRGGMDGFFGVVLKKTNIEKI